MRAASVRAGPGHIPGAADEDSDRRASIKASFALAGLARFP